MTDVTSLVVFVIVIITLLVADLYFLGRNSHKIEIKEAAIWTIVFIAVSLLFSLFIYFDLGYEKSAEFLAAYAIEKVLSVDNLFVFILVFDFFKVNEKYHHKVLFYGIMGALIFRAIFILGGVTLLDYTAFEVFGYHVNIVLFLFGFILATAGLKIFISKEEDEEKDFSKTAGAKLISKVFKGRITSDYHEDKFIVRIKTPCPPGHQINWTEEQLKDVGKSILYATPLLVVVAVIEFTDLLFAIDSIPAIFSISTDPFILYSSNIFAILGLRSMYFLLSSLLPMFKYLKYGLGIILAFIGLKMILAPILHINSIVSLMIVLGLLLLSIIPSVINRESEK